MPNEYVLVHGACHGAWCWDEVAARLRAKGHRVLAVDLPGHGRRAAEVRRAGMEAYGRAVADAMALEGVSRGVLVGHSMGGPVISKAAELARNRIRHLVYVAAVVLPDGQSIAESLMTEPARRMVRGMAAGRGNGTFLYPAETAWARWMGDVPRDSPEASRALALLTPQAMRPFLEPVDLRVFYALSIPRTYIRCLQDRAVVPARGAEFAARLGVSPVDMNCAHNPMLSKPDELAQLLEKI